MATASWTAHMLLPEQNQDDCYSQAVPHGPGEQRQDGGEVLLSQPFPGPGKTGKQRGQNKTCRASLFELTGGYSGLCCQNANSYDGGVGSGARSPQCNNKKVGLGQVLFCHPVSLPSPVPYPVPVLPARGKKQVAKV